MFEGVGAAILGFLAEYAGTAVLDRLVGERIDAFRANGERQAAFERSLGTALAQVERAHPGHARIFADRGFLEHHAVVELAKFFSAKELPSPDGLIARWRDHAIHLPAAAPAIATAFLAATRDALIEHAEFRELIWFKRDATDSERLRAVGDDVAAMRLLLEEMQVRQAPAKRQGVDHLPADLGDFEGRQPEIDRLKAILTAGDRQAAISALGGMGGIGKSALAVHAAHLLAEDAPDGRLFVDMGGRTGTPFAAAATVEAATSLSPVQAMVKVVALLEPERQVPNEHAAAQRAYRAALDGKRVLLVLDNAESSAQVRPLLDWRAPETMVLITSRRTITGPGLTPLPLGVMPPGEARALLRTTLAPRTADDDTLDLIATRCGHLPLALRVAGTYLAQNPHVGTDAHLAALADEKRRLRELRLEDDASLDVYAALALSARHLAAERPQLAARWRLLAVFPANFNTAAAAAVWDIDTDDASIDLGALRQRSMVLWDAADRRWRLHDLMRDVAMVSLHAQDLAPLDAGLNLARASHAGHFCGVLGAANKLYLEGGEAVLAGLALYDMERANIAAGQAWAAANSGAIEVAARLAVVYAHAGFEILPLRLYPSERIGWLEAQCEASVRLGDRASEGSALGNLGNAWWQLGEWARAIGCHGQALRVSREIGDRRAEAYDLGNLGNCWHYSGNSRHAIGLYEKVIAIAREIGDQRTEGGTLGNLGLAWAALGEPRRAIEFHERHLAIAREIGDRLGEGLALFNSALAFDLLGQREEAARRGREALSIFETIGTKHHVALVSERLAAWGVAGERS